MAAVISADLVKSLRDRTSAPMMECKRALEASDGDIEQAILELRKLGRTKADKKADREAKEGMIAVIEDGKQAVMVEVNSETDFVARDATFGQFVKTVAETAWQNKASDVATVSPMVEEARQTLVAKVGENIQIRRMVFAEVAEGVIGTYLHGQRIGVMVALNTPDAALARDIAMHIAASNPLVISPEDVPGEVLAKEKEVHLAQAATSGKPPEIIEKMVQGRLKKYLDEVSLLGQPFVKNPEQTVGSLLNQHHAKVLSFYRYVVGEGMEA